MGRMWEDWWRTHARAGTEPWQPEPARTGEWADVPEPMRNWKTWGVPLLARHDGLVWFRRTVTLTPAQASRAATLSLGAIDEVDQTWVNGRAIRNTFGWGTDRTYALPEGVLRAGENVIVVNVLSTWDAGGMTGPAEKLALAFDDGTKVALGGGWRYQVVPLEIGRPPRAPWESVAGLTTLYNGMIAPLGPFGVRGAVWYQGETNADAPAGYQAILAGLMSSWRAQLGAELPFVIVQLPGFGPAPTAPVESGWSDVRDAQRRAVAADPHAALAVTIDLGERDDIHPINKRDVGVRIAPRGAPRRLRRVDRADRPRRRLRHPGAGPSGGELPRRRRAARHRQLEPGHRIRAVRRRAGDLPVRERNGRGRSGRDSDERRPAARAAALLLGRQPGVQPLGWIGPAGRALRARRSGEPGRSRKGQSTMRAALIAGLAGLACGTAVAQQANVNLDYNPQKNTENLVPFSAPLNSPDVRDDRTVTFRLKAPEARTVSLAGVAILTALGQEKPVPFQKGADGVWSLTVGPLRPDMYAYHLVVDGVQVADPNNTVAAFTAMPPYSHLVVHGDGPAYYDARDVPHGTVARHVYRSGVTNGERELYVYTPPGYDRAKTYPVLYLVGGSGELPHNWVYDGRVSFIMDNLLAEGKVVPMVIAIPNNQVVHRNHPRHVELTFPTLRGGAAQARASAGGTSSTASAPTPGAARWPGCRWAAGTRCSSASRASTCSHPSAC